MKLLSLFACVSICSAQALTFTLTGPATALPGGNITITLTATGAADTGSAAVQWHVGLPALYTATAVAGIAEDANKTLNCTSDASTCLVWGLNIATIPNGVIATYTVHVPATAAIGPITIPLTGPLAVTGATGVAVPVVSGTPYSITILKLSQDLNGDGKVDITDVNLMSAEAIAAQINPAACVHDQTGDGKCDISDVFNVILKALGLI